MVPGRAYPREVQIRTSRQMCLCLYAMDEKKQVPGQACKLCPGDNSHRWFHLQEDSRTWDWGDGSFVNVFAAQTSELNFKSPKPHEKGQHVAVERD